MDSQPMQKFELSIKEVMFAIETLTENITDVLGNSWDYDSVAAEKVQELYTARKEKINALKVLTETAEINEYIRQNSKWWDEKIAKIIEHEKFHLEKLDDHAKGLGKELRKLMANKSLLLYTNNGLRRR